MRGEQLPAEADLVRGQELMCDQCGCTRWKCLTKFDGVCCDGCEHPAPAPVGGLTDTEQAIARVEASRLSHQLWIDYLDRNPDYPLPEFIQTRDEHQQIVDEYDNVLAVLAAREQGRADLAAERDNAQRVATLYQRQVKAAERARADLAAKVEALPRTWELHRCGVLGPGLRAAAASLRAVLAADSTPREGGGDRG